MDAARPASAGALRTRRYRVRLKNGVSSGFHPAVRDDANLLDQLLKFGVSFDNFHA
jgi:hypothetical protein